jgi:hypothetical protein
MYPPLYEAQWSDEWAAFRVEGPPQVDVVLTKSGAKWDAHHRLAWDLLRDDRSLLAEYVALKREPADYETRKAIVLRATSSAPTSELVDPLAQGAFLSTRPVQATELSGERAQSRPRSTSFPWLRHESATR